MHFFYVDEAGHWEGYQNGVHDQKVDDVVGKDSPSYIYIRNSDLADYLRTLNTPKPL